MNEYITRNELTNMLRGEARKFENRFFAAEDLCVKEVAGNIHKVLSDIANEIEAAYQTEYKKEP